MHCVGHAAPSLTTRKWSMSYLLDAGPRFKPVPRVSALHPEMQKIVDEHDSSGIPLVVEHWHKHERWPKDGLFSIESFRDLLGPEPIHVRNVHDRKDKLIPFGAYIEQCRTSEHFIAEGEQERCYGKDIECPKQWREWLHSGVIPPSLTPDDPANMMNYLPADSQVETLMCYTGIGDTFTPIHKDLCASSGHNLMCYTENDGCSFWFMTQSKDILIATDYLRSLGHEIDHELHAITLEELAAAPFDVYIVQQELGDLVLVPPRSCHQVVNYGGITTKTSWSRMTLDGLSVALYHELPIYQRVCRLETYRIKLTIYHALRKLSLCVEPLSINDARHICIFLRLFDHVLKLESPPPKTKVKCLETPVNDLVCDFCGADIFQSFFQCRYCIPTSDLVTANDGGLVLCPGCYVDGRQCQCSGLRPFQNRQFLDLLNTRQRVVHALQDFKIKQQEARWEVDESIDLNSQFATFCAAHILWKRSKTPGDKERSCRTDLNHPWHVYEAGLGIHCKGCHSSRCFRHHAEMWKLHSAQSLLAWSRSDPKTHDVYHALHKKSRKDYLNGQEKLFNAISEGSTNVDCVHLAMYLATTFKTCRPMDLDYTRVGWYDKLLREIPFIVSEEPAREHKDHPKLIQNSDDSMSTDAQQTHGGARCHGLQAHATEPEDDVPFGTLHRREASSETEASSGSVYTPTPPRRHRRPRLVSTTSLDDVPSSAEASSQLVPHVISSSSQLRSIRKLEGVFVSTTRALGIRPREYAVDAILEEPIRKRRRVSDTTSTPGRVPRVLIVKPMSAPHLGKKPGGGPRLDLDFFGPASRKAEANAAKKVRSVRAGRDGESATVAPSPAVLPRARRQLEGTTGRLIDSDAKRMHSGRRPASDSSATQPESGGKKQPRSPHAFEAQLRRNYRGLKINKIPHPPATSDPSPTSSQASSSTSTFSSQPGSGTESATSAAPSPPKTHYDGPYFSDPPYPISLPSKTVPVPARPPRNVTRAPEVVQPWQRTFAYTGPRQKPTQQNPNVNPAAANPHNAAGHAEGPVPPPPQAIQTFAQQPHTSPKTHQTRPKAFAQSMAALPTGPSIGSALEASQSMEGYVYICEEGNVPRNRADAYAMRADEYVVQCTRSEAASRPNGAQMPYARHTDEFVIYYPRISPRAVPQRPFNFWDVDKSLGMASDEDL